VVLWATRLPTKWGM